LFCRFWDGPGDVEEEEDEDEEGVDIGGSLRVGSVTREFLELVGNGWVASLSLFSDSISGILFPVWFLCVKTFGGWILWCSYGLSLREEWFLK
jgi:hypothetical protein